MLSGNDDTLDIEEVEISDLFLIQKSEIQNVPKSKTFVLHIFELQMFHQ